MGEFNVPQAPTVTESKKMNQIGHFSQLSSGAGSTILKQDRNGLFIGGTNYENAPWAVDYQGNQYIGAGGEIALDGPDKKITFGTDKIVLDGAANTITVGASSEVVLNGATGTITTDKIVDKTYGFYGVFVKQITTTSMSNINIEIGPDSGGLLNVSANYRSNGTGRFWWLTPVNHFYVYKNASKYYIYHAGVQIDTDTDANLVYYTCLFNSQESANGY